MNRPRLSNKLLFPLLLVAVVVVPALGLIWVSGRTAELIGAETEILPPQFSSDGFARAVEPWQWDFPRDHGPHPSFQTEWWYYTGNLTTVSGRRFGFQFTIFRRGLTPEQSASAGEWHANQIYMAHFSLSDIAGGTFHQDERFSRGAVGLAGAEALPRYRVWVEDWSVHALDDSARHVRIQARSEGFAIDLELTSVKPPAFHGVNGLSAKGREPGNASYYYSLSRLKTAGTVAIGDKEFTVSGTSWMDREFGTSALSAGAVGWDWFAVQLSDGRDLMVGQIRQQDGGVEPVFGGLLVLPDGSTRYLDAGSFSIVPLGSWQSKRSGATYPAGWEISVSLGDAELQLTLEPLLADQEIVGSVTYWEGAVRVSGDAAGYGYAELTGYARPLRGLF